MARSRSKLMSHVVGSEVIVYPDSSSTSPVRSQVFTGTNQHIHASAYFREQQGDPEHPLAHVVMHYVWSKPS